MADPLDYGSGRLPYSSPAPSKFTDRISSSQSSNMYSSLPYSQNINPMGSQYFRSSYNNSNNIPSSLSSSRMSTMSQSMMPTPTPPQTSPTYRRPVSPGYIRSIDLANIRSDTDDALRELEDRLRKEQHERMKAEEEQARLIKSNHELEKKLEDLNKEFQINVKETLKQAEFNLRQEEAKVGEINAKLHAMEEMKVKTTQQMNKFKAQAESVIRVLEARLADEEEAKKRALFEAKEAMEGAESKVVSNQVVIKSLQMQLKEEGDLRKNVQDELSRYISQHEAQVTTLQQQLLEAKQKEQELNSKLNHNNQLMQELRNKAVESNSTSALRTLLGTLQDPKAGNKGISGLDLERVKRESDRKEETFTKRIKEQDELINILRQTLSSVNEATMINEDDSRIHSTIVSLSKKVEYLTTQLAKAAPMTDLGATSTIISNHETTAQELKSSNKVLEDKVEVLLLDNDSLKNENVVLRKKVADWESQVEASKVIGKSKELEISELKRKVERLEEAKKQIQEEVHLNSSTTEQQLRQELESMFVKLEKKSRECETERDQVMEMRKQFQYEAQRYKDRIVELEQESINVRASLQMEESRSLLESQHNSNLRALEEERRRSQNYSEKIASLQEELRSIQLEDKRGKERENQQVKELQYKIQDMERAYEECKNNLLEAEGRAQLQQTIAEEQEKLANELNKQVQELMIQVSELNKSVSDADIKEYIARVADLESNLESLQQEYYKVSSTLKVAEEKLDRKVKELEAEKKITSQLKRKADELQQTVEDNDPTQYISRIGVLENSLLVQKEEVSRYREQAELQSESLNGYKDQIATLKNEVSKLNALLNQSKEDKSEATKYQTEINKQQAEISRLQSELSGHQKDSQRWKEEAAKAQIKIQEMESQPKKETVSPSQLAQLENKLSESVKQVEALREEKLELVSAVEHLRMEKETAEDNELKSLEAFDEAEQRAAKYEQRVQKLESFLVSIDINPETVDDYL